MSTLYEKVVSEKGLWQAWEKVRSNNGACGVDRQTVEHFAKAASQNISSLCRKLLEGNYRWQPLKLVKISKSDGSIRVLKIPVVKDRVIQTAMAQALSPVLEPEMEPCSYAYRPGRSVKMAVEKVSLCYQEGYRWIVDADIDDYFDNVPHKILLQLLQKYFDDPGLLAMISSWLEASSPQGIGLPQGSPLSPLLSNIYLDELDEKIQGREFAWFVMLMIFCFSARAVKRPEILWMIFL